MDATLLPAARSGWLGTLLSQRLAVRLLAGALLVHLLLALAFHLSPDEAHYALYALHLDWSYYDHPPLVGWLQWPGLVLGAQDVLMRVVPMLGWALSALGAVRLTQQLYPQLPAQAAASAALLLWVLSPLPHLLGVALVPDTLLMPLSCAVMLLTWRLTDPAQARRLSLWLSLGLALGLAGLSKYTAVLLGLGGLLALAYAHRLRLLALPGLWLATLLAGLAITPVIGWNASHGWISFAYQLGHAAGQSEWLLRRVATYLLVQILVYGALLLVGLLAAWRLRPDAPATLPAAARPPVPPLIFVLCFGAPPLLLYAFLSGRGTTLPHWSAPAWLALLPAAAAGCLALWQRRRRTLLALGGFQALVCAAMLGLIFNAGVGSETGAQAQSRPGELRDSAPRNPVADLYGWDRAARHGQALAAERGAPTLAVMNWSLASRVGWYARPLPVKVVQSHHDQFDLWFGPMQPGESVLLLDWSLMTFAPPVGPAQFERCELIEQLPITHAGRQIAHFNYLLCRHWQGAEEPPLGRPTAH
jgi:4-amino-4-deoxy-L-arabinose transferase-like glycosyltransferase